MAKKKVLKKQKPSEKQIAKKKASRTPVSKRALVKKVKARKAATKKAAAKKVVATAPAKKGSPKTVKVTKKTATVSAKTAKVVAKAPPKTPTKSTPKTESKTAKVAAKVDVKASSGKTAKVAAKSPIAPKKSTAPVAKKPAPVVKAAPVTKKPAAPSAATSAPRTRPVAGRPILLRPRILSSQPRHVGIAHVASPKMVRSPLPTTAISPRPRVEGAGQPKGKVAGRPAPGGRPSVVGRTGPTERGMTLAARDNSVVVFKRKPGSTVDAGVLRSILSELEFVTIHKPGARDSKAGVRGPGSGFRSVGAAGKIQAVHALDSLIKIPAPSKPRKFKPVAEQLAILTRGTVDIYSLEDLMKKLQRSFDTGVPLRVKLGLDPSRPDIHIGHAVVLRKLRQFQDLGHQAVVIIGDYTAMVGDPSGKSKTRPTLTEQEVITAAKSYFDQIGAILDTSNLEVRRNGEWFGRMTFSEVMKLAGRVTVARILERDDFSKRYEAQAPISLHEFFYPIMQGHDSVELKSDIELGGTDQTFNLLMGRKLQEDEGMSPQVCITTPLIPGLDGVEKMSKSLGNAISVGESPDDMFGKTMSIPDALMRSWFENLTDIPMAEVKRICDPSATNPREAKDRLAQEVVAAYHGREAAQAASQEFIRRFRERELPADMPVFVRPKTAMTYELLVKESGLAATTSEVRRLMSQNGLSVILPGGSIADAQVRTDHKAICDLPTGTILKAGKRRFVRLA